MRLVVIAGLLVYPVSAFAINTEPAGFYAGAGLSQVSYSGKTDASLTEKPDWTALELSGGYKHSPYVGVETRLGVGASPDLFYGGIYYRTESANETAKTYLLAGYSAARVSADAGGDFSLSGFSYGAGVGFPVGRNFNINLEYRTLLDDSDKNVNLNAFTASLDYRFDGSSFRFKGSDQAGESSNALFQINPGFYAGLGVAQIEVKIDQPSEPDEEFDEFEEDEELDEEGGDADLKWNAIEFIGGYSHSALATVEMRLGTTDSAGDSSVDWTLTYASLYYRPSLSFNKVNVYGLLGFSAVQERFQEGRDEETGETFPEEKESYSGLSVGAGVNLTLTEQLDIGLEYRLLARDKLEGEEVEESEEPVGSETLEFTALSANINYRF